MSNSADNPNDHTPQYLKFLAQCPEHDVVGFVSPSGAVAAQGLPGTPWIMGIELFAWRIDNGPIQTRQPFDTQSTLHVHRVMAPEELETLRCTVSFPSVVRFKAKVAPADSEFSRHGLLVSTLEVVQDQSLFDAGAAAMNQTVFIDPQLGRFRDLLAIGYWSLPIEHNFGALLIRFSAQNAQEFDAYRIRVLKLPSLIERALAKSDELRRESLYAYWKGHMCYEGMPMLEDWQFISMLKLKGVELKPDGMELVLGTNGLMDDCDAKIICSLDGTPIRAKFDY